MTKKVCSKCNETKPASEFSGRSATLDGLQYWCKQCMATYAHGNQGKRLAHSKEVIANHQMLELLITADGQAILDITMKIEEHPEDYDGPCMCRSCRSYGD